MKILMVAIPNHHFFQWVNQLKNSKYDVYWFDVTDGGSKSPKIDWVTQIKGWKLRWDFPLRSTIKKNLPSLYFNIQKINENNVSKAFKKTFKTIRPDIVHCFEMQLSGLPILSVMEQYINTPLIYSSWGSDVFYYEELGVTKMKVQQFYNRSNYLITDCERDYKLAITNGFKNKFLGVFPGNGGLKVDFNKIKKLSIRDTILIKGYDDGIGKASIVVGALEILPKALLQEYKIVIYSADDSVTNQIKNSLYFLDLEVIIHSRYRHIQNEKILEIMGGSCIHIANSISDGMPNALLEAMGMGAFPIQSNPGRVTEEVITHNQNGYLITNPLSTSEIAMHIKNALENEELRKEAQGFNINFIKQNYSRGTLQSKIVNLYNSIKPIH